MGNNTPGFPVLQFLIFPIMKFLIAGFGSIGRRHFRNLLALGERDIVFLRSQRSTLPDDEIAEFSVETEIAAALAHRPDAVIIANPTALHLDVAIPAAEQGCHLFIEKPVSHSLARIDELQAALVCGGGKAFMAFQYRFHPGLQRIQTWLSPNFLTPNPYRPSCFRACPLGRISPRLASLGGLPPRVTAPAPIWAAE